MAGIASLLYNTVYKRTSTFVLTIVASSIFFERSFDMLSEGIFDYVNKGKQWKDIKHKYE